MDVEYEQEQIDSDRIIAAVEKAGYGAAKMHPSRHKAQNHHRNAYTANPGNSISTTQNANYETITETSQEVCDSYLSENSKGIRRTHRQSDTNTTIINTSITKEDTVGKNQVNTQKTIHMKMRLTISAIFLFLLMYISMYAMFRNWFGLPIPPFIDHLFTGEENSITFAFTGFLLLLPILYQNRQFFITGFRTLAHFSPNMDSLVAIGASAAVLYGIFAMYRIGYGLGHGQESLVHQYAHDLYFESAGMILTLITVGKYLESRSKGKTSEAIRKLIDMSPRTAIILNDQGAEQEIPAEDLEVGDIFLIKPGSKIPADGQVLEGNSSIDESAITGESVPAEKRPGDEVIGATINKAGFLKCKAQRVGEDTTLAQVIRLVEEASAGKAPIAQLADRIAGIFVPIVIAIAAITAITWLLAGAGTEFALSAAIAVLVISCPCALGLATPVAIMVGTGVGASRGILFKSGEALQLIKEVDTVVLDKTGTVTEGHLTLSTVEIIPDIQMNGKVQKPQCTELPLSDDNVLNSEKHYQICDELSPTNDHVSNNANKRDDDCNNETINSHTSFSREQILLLAGALEQKSEHPLAEAIVEAAKKYNAPFPAISNFQASFGKGIEGEAQTDWLPRAKYFIGNIDYMQDQGIPSGTIDQIQDKINHLADQGQTVLLIGTTYNNSSHLLAILGCADEIRPTSEAAVNAWKQMGTRIILLTGDSERTAKAVARRLGIDEVIAHVLPGDKDQTIRSLEAAGSKVAMIGDGINDAPALMSAHVGIAIGGGTDIAIESADVILMKNDLRDAVTAMELGKSVIRNIKQNLFWAFFYNTIGIPLAAGVLYPAWGLRLSPMFGAAAMSLSSLFVVTNALRLRSFRPKALPQRPHMSNPSNQTPCATNALNQTSCPKNTSNQLPCPANPSIRPAKEHITLNNDSNQQKEIEPMTKIIKIEGMSCAHCTARVKKALEALDGVSVADVSLDDKQAKVTFTAPVSDQTLAQAVTDADYDVVEIYTA
jgi:Cu+-exporting ATPase